MLPVCKQLQEVNNQSFSKKTQQHAVTVHHKKAFFKLSET